MIFSRSQILSKPLSRGPFGPDTTNYSRVAQGQKDAQGRRKLRFDF